MAWEAYQWQLDGEDGGDEQRMAYGGGRRWRDGRQLGRRRLWHGGSDKWLQVTMIVGGDGSKKMGMGMVQQFHPVHALLRPPAAWEAVTVIRLKDQYRTSESGTGGDTMASFLLWSK